MAISAYYHINGRTYRFPPRVKSKDGFYVSDLFAIPEPIDQIRAGLPINFRSSVLSDLFSGRNPDIVEPGSDGDYVIKDFAAFRKIRAFCGLDFERFHRPLPLDEGSYIDFLIYCQETDIARGKTDYLQFITSDYLNDFCALISAEARRQLLKDLHSSDRFRVMGIYEAVAGSSSLDEIITMCEDMKDNHVNLIHFLHQVAKYYSAENVAKAIDHIHLFDQFSIPAPEEIGNVLTNKTNPFRLLCEPFLPYEQLFVELYSLDPARFRDLYIWALAGPQDFSGEFLAGICQKYGFADSKYQFQLYDSLLTVYQVENQIAAARQQQWDFLSHIRKILPALAHIARKDIRMNVISHIEEDLATLPHISDKLPTLLYSAFLKGIVADSDALHILAERCQEDDFARYFTDNFWNWYLNHHAGCYQIVQSAIKS